MNRFVLFVIITILLSPGFFLGASFQFKSSFDASRIALMFLGSPPQQVDRMDMVKLTPSLRPSMWPDHIPFVASIDRSRMVVSFLYYHSFFDNRLFDIEDDRFEDLTDIAVFADGRIFVADAGSNAIFVYRLDRSLKKAKFVQRISIRGPIRIDANDDGYLSVLSRDGMVSLVKVKEKSFVFADISDAVEKAIEPGALVQDLALSSEKELFLLSQDRLYKFDLSGRLLDEVVLVQDDVESRMPTASVEDLQFDESVTPTPSTFVALHPTWYGDVLVLDSTALELRKYSRGLEFITTQSLHDVFEGRPAPSELVVYEPFGYVGIATPTFGAYYVMGVEVDSLKLAPSSQDQSGRYYDLSFRLSFPAYVSVLITPRGSKKSVTLTKDTQLTTGTHRLFWDGLDSNGKPYKPPFKVKVFASAIYSSGNERLLKRTLP